MDHVEPEAELRALMTLQADGIRTHAIDQIMAPYHSDAVMFDIKPPFQIKGADAIREMWNQCLPYVSKAATQTLFGPVRSAQRHGRHVAECTDRGMETLLGSVS